MPVNQHSILHTINYATKLTFVICTMSTIYIFLFLVVSWFSKLLFFFNSNIILIFYGNKV